MGKINVGRVILAGLAAGIVSDALGYLVDGVLLAQRWTDGMLALGHPEFTPDQWIYFNALGLVAGIVLVWVYAAIKPSVGAPGLAAIAATLVVWTLGSLLPNLSFMFIGGLFTKHLFAFTTSGAFFEILIGSFAGAALYKDSPK